MPSVYAELEAKGRLNAVQPQQKFGGGIHYTTRLMGVSAVILSAAKNLRAIAARDPSLRSG
jgi:hypothetical protein